MKAAQKDYDFIPRGGIFANVAPHHGSAASVCTQNGRESIPAGARNRGKSVVRLVVDAAGIKAPSVEGCQRMALARPWWSGRLGQAAGDSSADHGKSSSA
jgi:hypothetical protein